MIILIHFLFSFLGTVAFGILTNIPKRALLSCGLTGAVGWIIFRLLTTQNYGLGTANFVASFAIGCLSIFFSRKKKMPMIIFNIPSLVPLVPGGPAYKAIREFVLGDNVVGFDNLMIVLITAGAIASGFMMTNLVEKVTLRWQTHYQKRA